MRRYRVTRCANSTVNIFFVRPVWPLVHLQLLATWEGDIIPSRAVTCYCHSPRLYVTSLSSIASFAWYVTSLVQISNSSQKYKIFWLKAHSIVSPTHMYHPWSPPLWLVSGQFLIWNLREVFGEWIF